MKEETPEKKAVRAAKVLSEDPALADLIEQHGPLTLIPADDVFNRLVVSVIRQQISMSAAAAIKERLFETVQITPKGVLAAETDTLEKAGLSASKAEYLRSVATAFQANGYDRVTFEGMSDEEVMSELTEIRGVGPWTAKMVLLFGLGRPDVFPVEDLGIRRGMELVCEKQVEKAEPGKRGNNDHGKMTRAEMRTRAEDWRPYRSYASLYLWKAYEG